MVFYIRFVLRLEDKLADYYGVSVMLRKSFMPKEAPT